MQKQERFDAAAALGEVRRVDQRVRAAARWHGWLWLLIGVLTPIFLIGSTVAAGDIRLTIAMGFGVAGLLLWYWDSRQRVVGREAARLDGSLTWTYVGLMALASILIMTVLPERFTVGLLVVGLLPAVSCFIGAWRIFRR